MFMCIWQGHLCALFDTEDGPAAKFPSKPPDAWKQCLAAGWEAHLEAANESDRPMVPEHVCAHCKAATEEEAPLKAGSFQSVFGDLPISCPESLVEVMGELEKAGAGGPGPLEKRGSGRREAEIMLETDRQGAVQEVSEWLGDQASVWLVAFR